MSNRRVMISGVIAAWILIPASAKAFEQQAPAMPAPDAPTVKVPDAAAPAASLDEQQRVSSAQEKRPSLKVPGIGRLSVPKLNFGLDLMYGSKESTNTDLNFTPDPLIEDSVTIMGKVKRRF